MKRALFRRYGNPVDVIEVIEEDDPIPGEGEVRVRNSVMTINPADLLSIEGRYGTGSLSLPATPGVGAYGIVDMIGEGVTRLAVGDAVLPIGTGLWADTVILAERMALKAPVGADPEQAALMRANPGTAYLLLTDIVDLQPGDWVVQNAANSNVGRMVIRFAREMGLHTVNIVRRADVVDALISDGADAVIVDEGQDIAVAIDQVAQVAPKLALDAVGGAMTRALGAALATRGTVVTYGLLSGQPNESDARDVVFRDIRLRGFWLFDWFQTAAPEKIQALQRFLETKLIEGVVQTDVDARYPLALIKEAVAHAARGGRNGKILLIGDSDA